MNEGKQQAHRIIGVPIQRPRPGFTEGFPLTLNSLPPACAIHDISDSTTSILTNMTSIHMFWASLRWKVDHQARPTTWLELFALFRIMGGGPRETDPHLPRLPFMPSIKAFIKASKALFKIVAEGEALELLRAAKGKAFLLDSYGLEVHLTAVRAEICLDDGLASRLHSMLSSIRLIKQGTHKGSLKASAAPLPKKEPWADILASAPAPIVTMMNNRKTRRLDNISMRGERGDYREQRPQSFILVCPTCATPRDCVNVRLFTTIARGLTCNNCKKSTSSTRWCCSHGASWTSCPIHREAGFRCGSHSQAPNKASFQGNRWTRSLKTSKASRSRQGILSKIGSLGEPKRLPSSCVNSVRSTTRKKTLVFKKTIKRQGSPPQQRESGWRGPDALHDFQNPIKNEHTRNHNEQHRDRVSYYVHSTSKYWLAHSTSEQPEGSTTSIKTNDKCIHKAGSDVEKPLMPAKRAKLSEGSFKQASACRGNCPRVWTIESYCELCHG
jgi:hypothetical protein